MPGCKAGWGPLQNQVLLGNRVSNIVVTLHDVREVLDLPGDHFASHIMSSHYATHLKLMEYSMSSAIEN